MTKKQMRKLAKEIIELEKIHRNKDSSPAAVRQAEERIVQITNMLMCLPGGMEAMLEIDEMVNAGLK